ncbi:hypothetical protein F7725_002484, partial [Dissostichus mawsoni]
MSISKPIRASTREMVTLVYRSSPLRSNTGCLKGKHHADAVSLWPRMEPFLLGALQMVSYVRTRDGCFPSMSWPMWRHIACGKLQLHEDLAWLYFETFDLLIGHLSVDTLQFLLFLYIQQLNRNWDDQAHLSFVQSHLGEILELLISLDALRSLALLLEGSAGPGRAVQPVHRLLTKPPLQTQAGFCSASRCFPLQKLLLCLQNRLALNPFGITACLHGGVHEESQNSQEHPHGPPGSKMVLMSQTSVHIHSCQNLRVMCVSGRIAIGVSSRCTIHTLTPTRPLLLPGNTDITLGPFHTFYPSLEDHMGSVGLAVVPNAWDRPLLVGTEGLFNPSLNSSSNPAPLCYRLLPPAEFNTVVVPFKMEGDTCEVPGGLPPLYQAEVEEKEKRIQNWQKTVLETPLNNRSQVPRVAFGNRSPAGTGQPHPPRCELFKGLNNRHTGSQSHQTHEDWTGSGTVAYGLLKLYLGLK